MACDGPNVSPAETSQAVENTQPACVLYCHGCGVVLARGCRLRVSLSASVVGPAHNINGRRLDTSVAIAS